MLATIIFRMFSAILSKAKDDTGSALAGAIHLFGCGGHRAASFDACYAAL